MSLSSSNDSLTDTENKFMVTKRERDGACKLEVWNSQIQMTVHQVDKQR